MIQDIQTSVMISLEVAGGMEMRWSLENHWLKVRTWILTKFSLEDSLIEIAVKKARDNLWVGIIARVGSKIIKKICHIGESFKGRSQSFILNYWLKMIITSFINTFRQIVYRLREPSLLLLFPYYYCG